MLSFSAVTLGVERGLRVDRCQRMSLTGGMCLLQG